MLNLTIKSFYRLFLCGLIAGGLAACATQTTTPPKTYKIKRLSQPATHYVTQAQTAKTTDQQITFELLAATRLLQDGSTIAAAQLLNRIGQQPLSSNQTTHLRILQTYLLLKRNEPKQAMRRLATVRNVVFLPSDIKLQYYQVGSEVYARNHRLQKSTFYRLLAFSLQKNLTLPTIEPAWQQLMQLPLLKLQQLKGSTSNATVSAWLQLAIVAKTYNQQPTALVAAIKTWQIDHPDHVANLLIPPLNQLSSASIAAPPKNIALLIPLHGSYAAMGNAIKHGFLTAYFDYHQRHHFNAVIKVYDTSQQDIQSLYKKAVSNGAQLVIGPLAKDKVARLANWGGISTPTIALNFAVQSATSGNLIELGLSPAHAAMQAAQLAWQKGASRLLIIKQKNHWYNATTNAFVTEWKALGGTIVSTLNIRAGAMAPQIASILQVTQSQQREKQLSSLLHQKLSFKLRRRKDIDGIFLLTTPALARQVKPLLNFYYANRVPVFSTSLVYNGYQQIARNHDLDGVYFVDMPWLFNPSRHTTQLKNQIKRLWPQNYLAFNRMSALGVDSFTLGMLYHRLLYLPHFPIEGVTGHLYLTARHQVYRQLIQATFKQGRARQLQ